MRAGDIVLLSEEAVVDLQLDESIEHIGVLIESEEWTMDSKNNISTTMWQVLVNNDVHILNEFSLSPLNIRHNSLQILYN